MKTACPHCSQHIEIDGETLASLQGSSHFACPACVGAVPVPPLSGSLPLAPPHDPETDPLPVASPTAHAHRGLNRNLLILGAAALLVLGGLAFFIASRKTGDTHLTQQTIRNEVINNTYFQQLIAAGKTTGKDLEAVELIRPYGDDFIGISKEPLSWPQALAQAKQTASEVLPVDSGNDKAKIDLIRFLSDGFPALFGSTTWVRFDGSPGVIDSPDLMPASTLERPRRALFRWSRKALADGEGEEADIPPLVDLAPETIPASWQNDGVVARIRGQGTMTFAKHETSSYLLETDITIHDPADRIRLDIGEPDALTSFSLGNMWPQDNRQRLVPCRLFRGQPFGVNWLGETHLPPDERLAFRLFVSDDTKILFCNGKHILSAYGDASDLDLRIHGGDRSDAIIHRCQWRPLARQDFGAAGLPAPIRHLRTDAKSKILSQIGESPATPAAETSFHLPDLLLGMKWIHPGRFYMGDPAAQYHQWGKGSEQVEITNGYWIGTHEITQQQWLEVMGANPSRITGSGFLPVNWISWSDANAFCEKLTAMEREAGRLPEGFHYRLPTEAEWEKAYGNDRQTKDNLERFKGYETAMTGRKIVEVGDSHTNGNGIYGMVGNVPEWCLDAWVDYKGTGQGVTRDRHHPATGAAGAATHVVRGGSFWNSETDTPTPWVRTRRHDVAGGFRGLRVLLGREIPAAQPANDGPEVDIDFSLRTKPFFGANENFDTGIVDGHCVLKLKRLFQGGVLWPVVPELEHLELTDFTCEVEVMTPRSVEGTWGIGLIRHKPPTHPWTGIHVNSTGQIKIYAYDENALTDWMDSPASPAGGAWYRLKVEVKGPRIKTYINDILVSEVTQQNRLNPTALTLFCQTTKPVEVWLRKIRVWKTPS